jgi:TolB-like protein
MPKQQSEPLLAVLPFDNLSSDPEMQFFSDGVSEDIIQRLANGAKLRVIGRTSSFQFRGDRKAEVARALNCSHVLDGSIRRAGSRVRVAAHLAESSSKTTIWSDRFDRGLEDIFAIQDEISESIAASLNRTFSPAPTQSVDPAVYDLYLRGNVQTTEPEALRAAIALLEEVTRRAPHFAPGWGKTAELRAWMLYYSSFADRRAMAARARHELERALALVPDLPSALIARAALLPPWGSFMEGEEADLPLQTCSGDAATMGLSALFPESVGRMRESLARSRRGFELDALNAYSCHMLGKTLWFNGQFAQARAQFQDNLARWPDLKVSANNLIMLCADLGDWNAVDALLAPERLAKFPLQEFETSAKLYVASKRHRSPQVQNEFVKHMQDDFRQNGYADTTALTFAAHFGAIDEAYDIAAKARLRPAGDGRDAMGYDAYRTYIMFHAAWPELRSDPRFITLCARLGLVEYWLSTRKWPDCADTVPYDFRAECETHRDHPKDTFPL